MARSFRSREAHRLPRAAAAAAARFRRLLQVGAAVALALAVAPAAGAHGDPTGKSDVSSVHFLSVLTVLTPEVPGLELSVADRNDRLVLTNDTGKTVIVKGYSNEGYLRFDTRGVWVNRHSPNHWLDRLRFVPEDFKLPQAVDENLPPDWLFLTTGDTWEWHDHRINWGYTTSPAGIVKPVNGKFTIRDWGVGIIVDGAPAIINGRLDFYVNAQGTGGGGGGGLWRILAIVLPVAAVVAAGGGWLLFRRRRRLRALPERVEDAGAGPGNYATP